jgi:hypothetical protein
VRQGGSRRVAPGAVRWVRGRAGLGGVAAGRRSVLPRAGEAWARHDGPGGRPGPGSPEPVGPKLDDPGPGDPTRDGRTRGGPTRGGPTRGGPDRGCRREGGPGGGRGCARTPAGSEGLTTADGAARTGARPRRGRRRGTAARRASRTGWGPGRRSRRWRSGVAVVGLPAAARVAGVALTGQRLPLPGDLVHPGRVVTHPAVGAGAPRRHRRPPETHVKGRAGRRRRPVPAGPSGRWRRSVTVVHLVGKSRWAARQTG